VLKHCGWTRAEALWGGIVLKQELAAQLTFGAANHHAVFYHGAGGLVYIYG
jgi:hypothetical protein